MAIRHYRRPLPNPQFGPAAANTYPVCNYEEIFVILETPLLEFTQKDLALLRELKVDPFRE